MNILHVLRAPVGGLFRHVRDLSHGLAEHGHSLGMVVGSGPADSLTHSRLGEATSWLELGIHFLALPRGIGAADALFPLRLARLCRELGIDVIHGHGAKGGFHARIMPGLPHVARVYTPHGGSLHYPSTTTSGVVFQTLERAARRAGDAIVFESGFARRTYESVIGPAPDRSRVIVNGVRPEEFIPVSKVENPTDFLFVGELRRLKGLHVLLAATARLRDRTGVAPTLTVVGEGPDSRALIAQAGRLGLADAVTFAAAMPAREAFALGRCLVISSLAESLPYVLLEGVAAGMPVISTSAGGIPEVFGPLSSRLLPPDDAEALSRGLSSFLEDSSAAGEDAVFLRDQLRTRFTVENMVQGVEDVYGEVFTGSSRRR